MAGPTQRVVAGSGWTEVLSARGRAALAEIDAYGAVQIAVAEGKPPRAGVTGHTVNGRWRRPLRGKEIVWARGAGVAVIATLLWADPDLAFSIGQDGNAAVALEVAQGAATAASVADGKADSALDATGFNTPANTLLKRPVVQRARDSVSALDLMTAGGLDEAVRNREATSADRLAITDNVQEALAACASRGWQLKIPSGEYYLGGLQATAPVQIAGDGSADTFLYFSGDGISINSGAVTRQSSVRGLRVFAETPNAGDAVSFDHGDSFSLTSSRTTPRVLVDDLQTDQIGTGYWDKGLVLRNCMQSRIRGHSHRGYLANSALPEANWTGIALSIEGDTDHQPAQVFASQLNYTAIHTAIASAECEGVYINQFEVPTCWKGLVWANDGVNTGNAALILSDGHFNSRMGSVDLTNVTDYRITQIFHYLRNTPDANLSLVTIRDGCNRGQIHANLYRCATTAAVVTAIDVQGGSWLDIYNEQFDIGATGRSINIASSALNTDIGVNKYISGLRVQDASASTTYQERYGYSGSLNDIALQSRRSDQVHHLVTGASMLPTGASAAGATVVTHSQGATQGMQVFYPAGEDRMYRRRYNGGAWTAWRFVELTGVPA